jgi:hypothetical protein
VWYSKEEYYSIHTSAECSYRKDEQYTDGKIKEHAQRCRFRTRILARGNGYIMLLGQSIILISTDDKTPH